MLNNESLQRKMHIRDSYAPILIKIDDSPLICILSGLEYESHVCVVGSRIPAHHFCNTSSQPLIVELDKAIICFNEMFRVELCGIVSKSANQRNTNVIDNFENDSQHIWQKFNSDIFFSEQTDVQGYQV